MMQIPYKSSMCSYVAKTFGQILDQLFLARRELGGVFDIYLAPVCLLNGNLFST